MSADPIKVAYDVSGLRHRGPARGGVFRTSDALARRLAASPDCDLVFCTDTNGDRRARASAYLSSVPELRHVPFRDIASIDFGQPGVLHWEYRSFPALTAGSRRTGPLRRFMTVHDLITVRLPHLCDADTIRAVRDALASLDESDWVICVSHSAKRDLCHYLPHVRPANVFVIHHAASNLFYPVDSPDTIAGIKAKYGIPEGGYVLCLNRMEQRKNIAHVVRCFERLLEAEQLKDLSLVLAGAAGWDPDDVLESARRSSPFGDRIVVTGFVEDHDLAALYSGATVFVYPSLYEGFGLPPLEAMQCGTPVVTSNTSSLPEVVGGAGRLLDPYDQDGLCQALLEIHESASLREEMSRKSVERARMFSWEECARQTIDAYRQALDS